MNVSYKLTIIFLQQKSSSNIKAVLLSETNTLLLKRMRKP
ncbi:hypothetical protein NC99_30880 [Sunxiuqinia dokdonensis]|uniref:Uncharacterized protein n=1 Tax=Sunxiuqinia dokdonensis TaxID=1409788 RepID=A0A0L8V6I7_9BACT|nr:hypothetical protein NC99_30880 [Sunxiuqinia dokdonensis]